MARHVLWWFFFALHLLAISWVEVSLCRVCSGHCKNPPVWYQCFQDQPALRNLQEFFINRRLVLSYAPEEPDCKEFEIWVFTTPMPRSTSSIRQDLMKRIDMEQPLWAVLDCAGGLKKAQHPRGVSMYAACHHSIYAIVRSKMLQKHRCGGLCFFGLCYLCCKKYWDLNQQLATDL